MKTFTLFSVLVLFIALHSPSCYGQDLSALTPVVHYTLINTADDALGLQPPIELTNAPFSGNDGVFSNGTDPFQPGGSFIRTPLLSALYDSVFAVQVEFKITELDNDIRAVIVCGESSRYLGFAVWTPTTFKVIINNNEYVNVPGAVPIINTWYKLTIIYHASSNHILYYLNGLLIADLHEMLIRGEQDSHIENDHAGGGWTFKGYLRHLKVFSSAELSAVKDFANENFQLKLSPNPASDQLRFDCPPFSSGNWLVIDAKGSRVLSGEFTGDHDVIDIGRLASGGYILEVLDNSGSLLASKVFIKSD